MQNIYNCDWDQSNVIKYKTAFYVELCSFYKSDLMILRLTEFYGTDIKPIYFIII